MDSSDVDAVTLTRVPRAPDGRVDLDRVAATLPPADLLETAPGYGGWSYVIPHIADRLVDDGERATWRRADGTGDDAGDDPYAAIDRWCARYGVDPHATPDPGLPPFSGGLVGAVSYDLGRRTETIPVLAAADRGPLHLSLRVAPVVVAVSPDREQAWLVTRPLGDDPRPAAAAVRARLASPVSVVAPARPQTSPVRTSLPRGAYLEAVEAILAHIAAGDVFQVNLAQRLSLRTELSAAQLYRRLRDASPAPHAAFLPDIGVASVSPETFLRVDAGTATTRPIKGTRPRHHDPDLDAADADDLATSAKDRAENVMVVDLERNDLGRVCRPGTVRVPTLCAVEAHPTVWHLVSEVVGDLRADVGYGELLRATFPCGSITGAPKIAAMRLIERLEPVRRGWYCGAVGFLAPGAASLSVAIRTATRSPDGTVDHGAGGGIVADSDPAAEHAESLTKAAAFLHATGAVSRPARSAGAPRARGDAG